jgi:predicted 3-demethylubiquinone-9 3-methyltransferase (glyoxalase superfamily)
MIQGITPFLWFDGKAEEAMNHYISVFKNSRVLTVNRFNGKVLTVSFELEGQRFMALNAEPLFKFNEAVSFFVTCETQQDVDELWERLSADSETSQCGWVKDKFGLWWQIIPTALMKLMGDPNPTKSNAVMQAMLKMDKIVIDDLQKAYDLAA